MNIRLRVRNIVQRGFTLIELMITVAIIAIIATIVAINYTKARAHAAVAATELNLHQAATIVELYYQDHQAYPAIDGQIGPAIFGGAGNKYLSVPMVDTRVDFQGNSGYNYQYMVTSDPSGTGAKYTIMDETPYPKILLANLQGPTGGPVADDPANILYSPNIGMYAMCVVNC